MYANSVDWVKLQLFRYLYWLYLDNEWSDYRIYRAAMYGTAERNFEIDVDRDSDFVIDSSDQKLYWTKSSQIQSYNLDPGHIKFFKVTFI